jgi:thiol:disulfide interchange protein DsbG
MKLSYSWIAASLATVLVGCSGSMNNMPAKSEISTTPVPVLTPVEKGQNLIETLSHHTVQVRNHFDAPGGILGYIVQPLGKKRGTIVYTDSQGEYLFSGAIISDKGENLTQKEAETYIDLPLMDEMYDHLSGLNYFKEGQDSAPHKLTIIFDPNCSICHVVYGVVEPKIAAGELQVRWIPVGIMQQSSVGKAAAILQGKTDAERIALLKQDEDHFDLKTESGGVPELKLQSSSDKNAPTPLATSTQEIEAAFNLVATNNQYFSDYGFSGTPVFFLKYSSGEKKFFPGFYQGTWLSDEIAKTGADW